jgi:hypothetical protein
MRPQGRTATVSNPGLAPEGCAVDAGWQGLTLRLFRRVRDDVRTSIEGATAEELDRRLGSNSVGWLVWHIPPMGSLRRTWRPRLMTISGGSS